MDYLLSLFIQTGNLILSLSFTLYYIFRCVVFLLARSRRYLIISLMKRKLRGCFASENEQVVSIWRQFASLSKNLFNFPSSILSSPINLYWLFCLLKLPSLPFDRRGSLFLPYLNSKQKLSLFFFFFLSSSFVDKQKEFETLASLQTITR